MYPVLCIILHLSYFILTVKATNPPTTILIALDEHGINMQYGTVSAKIAPWLKCYKNASRLNRYNFPTDNAIDFLFSTLHSEMV